MSTAHLHLPPVGSRFFLSALGALIPRAETMKGNQMRARTNTTCETFADVPAGYLFDTTHLGKQYPFLKLRGECLISNFRRADPLDPRQSRLCNAIFLREGELIYIDLNPKLERGKVKVSNIRAPAVKSYHRLRDNLYWFQRIGNQWIEVNVVREEPDANTFGGLSGTLEYNKDFAKPPVGCRH